MLEVAGLEWQHGSWGRNLLNLPEDDPGFAYFSETPEGSAYGWINEHGFILRNGDDPTTYFSLQHEPMRVKRMEPSEVPPKLERAELDMDLYVKSALNAFLVRSTAYGNDQP